MILIRQAITRVLSVFGYELCRLSPLERPTLPENVRLNYKDAQIYRALTAQGQLSIEGARFLSDLVRSCDPQRPIVEIGCLYGYSTQVVCLAKHPRQRLYSVDNFSWNSLGISRTAHLLATRKRLQEYIETQNVHLFEGSAEMFYSQYCDLAPALFFCDADHSYKAVTDDIAWAKSVGASIICGDDYAPQHQGVVAAVDENGGAHEVHGRVWRL
ncbi:MAG TPA: class I SAM-dependent methyltransferase [Candidatus Competibacteraceae bacterium]|nr:MAG: class I SAM-dependent methyltransferase [Candidatus Competibacteraceae bacterium]HQC73301.1 class I SAM-dependent methyltransferase [Candidatus Competibacteraceae bacterium]